MHRALLGAALAVVTLVSPVPASADVAGASAFAMVLDLAVDCFGCGNTGGTLRGDVVAGTDDYATGATVSGTFHGFEPPGPTCATNGTMTGSLTVSTGHATTFTLTRTGAGVVASFGDGSTAAGTFTVTSPAGNPCGGPARATVTLGGQRFPRASGHVTIHRFPGTGALFLAAPVAQNGRAWWCTDVHTGATVTQGAVLTSPDPGVECYPPGGYNPECRRLAVGGYFAARSTAGSIETTATCGSASLRATIATGAPASTMSPVSGSLPLRCVIDETLSDPATTDYWTYCQVNAP